MSTYPTRTLDRTEGDAMFPEGRPTKKEQKRMADHAQANRVNKARENGHKADFFSLADQDRYVTSSSVKGMMWEAADGENHLRYEMGTIWIYGEAGKVVGRVQIEERSPYPFDKPAKQGAPMCLALSRPARPAWHPVGAGVGPEGGRGGPFRALEHRSSVIAITPLNRYTFGTLPPGEARVGRPPGPPASGPA
jgi:hypothetical protein